MCILRKGSVAAQFSEQRPAGNGSRDSIDRRCSSIPVRRVENKDPSDAAKAEIWVKMYASMITSIGGWKMRSEMSRIR